MQRSIRHRGYGMKLMVPSFGASSSTSGTSTHHHMDRTRRRRREEGKNIGYVILIVCTAFIGVLYIIHISSPMKKQGQHNGINPDGPSGFEFRGYTRTDGSKPRIAIVTNAVAYPYNEKTTGQWSMFKEFFANKDCYARTHGYDLIVDSRNHVDGMGFYTNAETGERGPTNVHFNKPYLLRKWLPHYDWLLWLDMDTLIVNMEQPIEHFIEEVGGEDGDIHVLVPQDQNVQFFFSACSLLLRNSSETKEMVEDWFTLKDTCPFALYDDQSRLYAAILRMQLRWRGLAVDQSNPHHTDCLDRCQKKSSQRNFSWCFHEAVIGLGIHRVPALTPPVAYSRLPTDFFTRGTDTGLSFQGQFGGIKIRPHLVADAFAIHTKPFCQRGGVQICSPFVDAILAPNYQRGMQRCYGRGWLAKPYAALSSLHLEAAIGKDADNEALALRVENMSSPEALIPGMNVPYGLSFRGIREATNGHWVAGPGWRTMGIRRDKKFCFASLPGSAGSEFMDQVLGPILSNRFCAHGDCSGINLEKAERRARMETIPCKIRQVWQVFPYTLMGDYADNSKQRYWLMSILRDPVDRVLAAFSGLKLRLAEEAILREKYVKGPAGKRQQTRVQNDWSRTLNRWCTDTSMVQYAGNPPPILGPDMTVEEYVQIPGTDDIMTKFYLNKEWDSELRGGLCSGRSRPVDYRPGGWEQFHHWQANAAVGALMEYQYFGVWELWKESTELLQITLGAEYVDPVDLDPPPDSAKEVLWGGSNEMMEQEVERLRNDDEIRSAIWKRNKKDVMLYQRAVMEFKRRCRYFGIDVPDDPYRLEMPSQLK